MTDGTLRSKTIATSLKFIATPEAAAIKFVDTIDIDQEGQRLYAGDNWSGGVDVFDISTPEAAYLKTIAIRGTFYGVTVARDLNKLFVGMSGSILAVIDIEPGSPTVDTVIARVHTGGVGAVDLLEYVPSLRKVYAANRADGFLAVVDAVNNVLLSKIEGLTGGIEQPRFYAGDGMVYLTGNTGDVLYQINSSTDTLVNTFPINEDCHPNGLAINPTTGMALLACNNRQRPHTLIWDLTQQKIASVIPESGAGDGAIYDETIDRFFFAASAFSDGPVMGIYGGNPVEFLGNVPTARMASWVAYDRAHRLVYAPAIRDGMPALVSFPLPDL
jgi:DNA-binding beta-propeller fold protein YncE